MRYLENDGQRADLRDSLRRDPVSAAAALTAIGNFGAARVGANAQSRAAHEQRLAAQQALAEEERQFNEQLRMEQEQRDALKQAWEQKRAERHAILQRHGRIRSGPPPGYTAPGTGAPPGWVPGGVPTGGSPVGAKPGVGASSRLSPPLVPPRSPWGDWGV